MLCEQCHNTEATVHITEVVAGQMTKRNLCEACWNETESSEKWKGKTGGWTSYDPGKTILPDDEPGH